MKHYKFTILRKGSAQEKEENLKDITVAINLAKEMFSDDEDIKEIWIDNGDHYRTKVKKPSLLQKV